MRTPLSLLSVITAGALLLSGEAPASPRALLIGVADVPHNELPGIDLDINNMTKVAEIMGFAPGDIKVLYNEHATYANVKAALATWVRDGVGPNDHVLIYFSGHGTRVPDPKPENANGAVDALVLHDVAATRVQGKATLKGVLIGHEFGAALAAIPSRNVLVLVDACHSGSATRTLKLGNLSLGVGTGVQKYFSYPDMPQGETFALRALRAPSGSDNYAALSAARDTEFALSTEQGGLFTLGVVDAIDKASREHQRPSVEDLRASTTAFIASRTDEQSRHHPVADGNERLIKGALDLIPPHAGQGTTWQALAVIATQAEQMPLALPGGAHDLRLGEKIVIEVQLPRGGYLNVVSVDSQDHATVLYPNRYSPGNEVKAGRFQFPTMDMNFDLQAAEPTGPSLVVAYLSDKPVNLLQLGIDGRDAAGQMQQTFTDVSARGTRALVVVQKQKSQLAAGSLTVTVAGKAAH